MFVKKRCYIRSNALCNKYLYKLAYINKDEFVELSLKSHYSKSVSV